MANLKEIKNRISSIVATQQITKAMKMVAAAKLRKSQDQVIQIRPFAQKLSNILHLAIMDESELRDWYNEERPEKHILIIAITSDRGLCGSFNNHVIKTVIKHVKDNYTEQHNRGDVTILSLGRKAHEYFKKADYKCEDQYWDLLHRLSFEKASVAASFVIDAFRYKKYDKIEIVYNQFKNVVTQVITVEHFLPLFSTKNNVIQSSTDYIYQPARNEIIAGLIPKLLKTQLFKALLESIAAENGARMTAMDKATENAGELLKELKLTYNRTRQAMITKEILEIVGGAEALKNA